MKFKTSISLVDVCHGRTLLICVFCVCWTIIRPLSWSPLFLLLSVQETQSLFCWYYCRWWMASEHCTNLHIYTIHTDNQHKSKKQTCSKCYYCTMLWRQVPSINHLEECWCWKIYDMLNAVHTPYEVIMILVLLIDKYVNILSKCFGSIDTMFKILPTTEQAINLIMKYTL